MAKQILRCARMLSTLLVLAGAFPHSSGALPQQPIEAPPGIAVERDVVYARMAGQSLRLDVFYPRDTVEPRLGVLLVHGERPRGRDKSHYWPMASALATYGFVAATIEYRSAQQARYPAASDDVKAALRWMRENARKYQINARKIAAVGENFGGYLVALMGVAGEADAVAAIHPVVDLPAMIEALAPSDYPYEYASFLGFPQPQRPDLWLDASPLNRASANSAPFLFLHGVDDKLVPYQQSARMKIALEGFKVSTQMLSPPGAGNGYFDAPDIQGRFARRIAGFFYRMLWEPANDVVQVKDIVYAQRGGRELRLDLFQPKSGSGPYPGIVFVHGGGWMWGDKQDVVAEAAALARKGFVTASIQYRLAREHRYPAAVDDVKAAIRWMRANAAKYQVRADRIGATGLSAGGHLVALLAVTPDRSFYEDSNPYPGVSASVQAVAPMAAPVDMVDQHRLDRYAPSIFLGSVPQENPTLWADVSPINHVRKDAAAFLFLHGNKDEVVSYDKVVEMMGKLKSAGVQAELFTADNGDHDFIWKAPWRTLALKAMEDFFTRTLKK